MKKIFLSIRNLLFPGSSKYWEKRYQKSGNSGAGSYGEKAMYKAGIINAFVEKFKIQSVMELGSGDGNQLGLLKFPNYIGLDVSNTAISNCNRLYKDDSSKKFYHFSGKNLPDEIAPIQPALTISLDVIYHLVEDDVFENYMNLLFNTSAQFVIIYAWDVNGEKKYHVRHRKFSEWVEQKRNDFKLLQTINSDKGYCDFFFYEKV